MMHNPLRILNVEDSEDDSLLLKSELEKGGLELAKFRRMETGDEMDLALAECDWDIVISDYALPGFGGLQALELLQASGRDIPFILISGLVGEDAAVEAMKAGAHDFICKANMARLVPAILRELDEFEVRRQRRLAEERLKESEAKFRALHQNASDAIFYHDLDGVILEVNEIACDWLGYTREELLGRKFSEFIMSLTPEQLAALSKLPPMQRHTYQAVLTGRNGALLHIEVNARMVTVGGEAGMLAIARDVTERLRLYRDLQLSEAKYRMLIEAASDAILLIDAATGTILEANQQAELLLGCPAAEIVGMPQTALHPPEEAERYHNLFMECLAHGKCMQFDLEMCRRDGRRLPVDVSASILDLEGKQVVLGIFRDVTTRNNAELQLRKLSRAVEQSPNTVVITNIDGNIEYVNPRFSELTGYALEDIIGKTPRILKSGEALPQTYERLWQTLLAGDTWHGEFHNRKKNGDLYWCLETISPLKDEKGHITHFIAVSEDISELKHAESTIKHLAYFDPLTDLPNRRLFHDRLEQAMIVARCDGSMLAVVQLDLDRFKLVNDTLGHDAGDRLLKAVAERLQACLREGDTIARLSGDEFAVIVPHLASYENIMLVAEKIFGAMQQPFRQDGREVFVTTSIGIAIFPVDADDSDTLCRHALAALYEAKGVSCNNYRFFSAGMDVARVDQLELMMALRRALDRKEFVLHYQPQVDIESGRIVGVEALVRWMHPVRGIVPPAEFIPLAEETGLIEPLGEWIMETACAQARAWQDAGIPAMRVAVNLSARQFMRQGLADRVARILQNAALDPGQLELELTESILMKNAEESMDTLQALRKMGVALSVDDFGTGYSSLSYLKRFPVTSVKIDRSFMRNVTTDPEDAALTKAIIAMAHSLRLRVIAEGVETESQLAFLADHRCHEVQGYYISRPLPADECAKLLQQYRLPQASASKAEEHTLLLVDDEVNIAAALKRLLRDDGYRILTADSGEKGLELLALNEVGVILTDQRMPNMTGVEFLRRVKGLYPQTVRMVLSGYTDLKSVTDAVNEGAIYKFLTKPWEDEQLRDNVREAFQRYDLKQENARLAREIERANNELSEINRDLELREEDKTQQANSNTNMLQISQKVLESLPATVIGIDENGLIIMANHQADALFAGDDGPLLGCEAHARLPAAFADYIGATESSTRTVALADGRYLHVVSHRMGETFASKGTLLVISPVESAELAATGSSNPFR